VSSSSLSLSLSSSDGRMLTVIRLWRQICLSHFSRAFYEGRPLDTAGETFFRAQVRSGAFRGCP
jgi:hypothetical protein